MEDEQIRAWFRQAWPKVEERIRTIAREEIQKAKLAAREEIQKAKLARAKPVRASTGPLFYGFLEFYKAYPLHKARADAERAWNTLQPSQELRLRIMAALGWQVKEWASSESLVPYPATYLNAKRWEDQPKFKLTPERISEPTPFSVDKLAQAFAPAAASEARETWEKAWYEKYPDDPWPGMEEGMRKLIEHDKREFSKQNGSNHVQRE